MITVILQARLGSERLPRKVLRPVYEGKSVIAMCIERVYRSDLIARLGQVIVAIPDTAENNELETEIRGLALKYPTLRVFRGSEHDVLDRFMLAAGTYDADTIIRITGDCPLVDPEVVDSALTFFNICGFDYVTNRPSYPDGFDVEVFSWAALESAWCFAKLQYEREHVTPYMAAHPEQFAIGVMDFGMQLPEVKLSVDTPEDMERVRRIFNTYGDGFSFSMISTYLEAEGLL